MKKLLRSRKHKNHEEQPTRITNETVAEHRERILAGGRRFKYPVQYARHRLVINTIIISLVALVLLVVLVWWQLYMAQNSSTFFYRITRVVPLPVALVDGQSVPYSDYLVGYRSHVHYLEFKEGVNLNSKENHSQVDYIKRTAMDDAVADSYAAKLAHENNIAVTDAQVDKAIERQRRSRDGVASIETYNAIILDHFDWSPDEARGVTARKLLRQEVAYKIDDQATRQKATLETLLKTQTDFDKIATQLGGLGAAKVSAGITPLVPSNNQDGGLAMAAADLKKGQTSSVFKSTTGDGYYVVRLLDSDSKGQVSYAYIKIPLTVFNDKLTKVHSEGKVQEYINVPTIKTQI
jgi:SurA N-terminal domain